MPRKRTVATPEAAQAPSQEPRAHVDGLPVWCAFDRLVEPATLKPDPKNHNQHPTEQVAGIVKSIRAQGWQKPIVVDTRTGYVVTGHGELMAAQSAGLALVPVDFRYFATDAARKAWLIADNEHARRSIVDTDLLKENLAELEAAGIDLEIVGVDLDIGGGEEDGVGEAEPPSEFKEMGEDIETQFECPSCHYKWSGKPK